MERYLDNQARTATGLADGLRITIPRSDYEALLRWAAESGQDIDHSLYRVVPDDSEGRNSTRRRTASPESA
jgi:hypothetical protein